MKMMNRRLCLLAAVPVLMGGVVGADAQTGPYIQMDMGAVVATPVTVEGSDNDWSTKCDLIINPLGAELAAGECDAAPPRSSWTNAFGGGAGHQTGFTLGYDWGAVRLEAEYFHQVTAYDDVTDIDIFDDVTADKREQEIELAEGSVDDLRSHSLFGNVYYDFMSPSSSWTPYVGAGVGAERASLDYGTTWKRNDDPDRIATFVDPLLRAKVAGTTTIGEARLTDVVLGYQVFGGVDYRLSDPVTMGVKFRWVDFGTFTSEPTLWNQLRSHESDVGRGEAVRYVVTTDDRRFWGISLNLKYRF